TCLFCTPGGLFFLTRVRVRVKFGSTASGWVSEARNGRRLARCDRCLCQKSTLNLENGVVASLFDLSLGETKCLGGRFVATKSRVLGLKDHLHVGRCELG